MVLQSRDCGRVGRRRIYETPASKEAGVSLFKPNELQQLSVLTGRCDDQLFNSTVGYRVRHN